jgi:ribosomal protein L17
MNVISVTITKLIRYVLATKSVTKGFLSLYAIANIEAISRQRSISTTVKKASNIRSVTSHLVRLVKCINNIKSTITSPAT